MVRMESRYDQLSRANTVDEILAVTRDYLSTWSAQEIERLPAACRPGDVCDALDVEIWSDRLTGELRNVALLAEDESRLHRLVSHFLIASVRMRQLGRHAPGGGASR